VKRYKNYNNENLNYKYRRNDYIRGVSEVRVVDEEGELLGVMAPEEALKIAREKGLDLVEIAPTAKPPVCKIIEWSKFKYEYSKKQKGSKPAASQTKEIWFKPMTDSGDLDYRLKRIREFLDKKNKVKITVKPGKDRRLDKSFYFEQIKKVLSALEDVAEVEKAPQVEGRNVYAIIKGKK
jgi:translation initiation factor IF-3